jgi:hypothetical protein
MSRIAKSFSHEIAYRIALAAVAVYAVMFLGNAAGMIA